MITMFIIINPFRIIFGTVVTVIVGCIVIMIMIITLITIAIDWLTNTNILLLNLCITLHESLRRICPFLSWQHLGLVQFHTGCHAVISSNEQGNVIPDMICTDTTE